MWIKCQACGIQYDPAKESKCPHCKGKKRTPAHQHRTPRSFGSSDWQYLHWEWGGGGK